LVQFTTTIELLNNIRKPLGSTQQKTHRKYEESRNNKKLYQISLVRNAIFTALSQSDQLTTNNHSILVLSNRSVPT